jgi:hypothetical protein
MTENAARTGAPVLFLDFDGVLNHSCTTARFRFPGGAEFTGLDAANVARLNAICAAVSDARIVVSSTWRTMLDVDALRAALVGAGFAHPERVVDRTPGWRTASGSIVGTHPTRGHEIQAWIDAQPAPPRVVAILDDCEDMAHLEARLVRTDLWDGGLLEEHVPAVVAKLSEAA